MHREVLTNRVRGYVQVFHVFGDEWIPQTERMRNTIAFQWADIAARRLTSNEFDEFVINGMYIEFCNVATPASPVGIGVTARSDTVDGFLDTSLLPGASGCDVVRVPVLATSIRSTDLTKYKLGNAVTFTAQTTGNLGSLFATPYENSQNSKVYGSTLVAIRDEADVTQDLIFARIQYDFSPVDKQVIKPVGGQVGVVWEIEFQ